MAGVATYTETWRERNPALVKIEWTSATAGTVDAAGSTTYRYTGILSFVSFQPGTTPTDNYDVQILDENSNDILNGLGTDTDSAANAYKAAKDGLGSVVDSKLTLAIQNAGDAKTGTIYLYIVR